MIPLLNLNFSYMQSIDRFHFSNKSERKFDSCFSFQLNSWLEADTANALIVFGVGFVLRCCMEVSQHELGDVIEMMERYIGHGPVAKTVTLPFTYIYIWWVALTTGLFLAIRKKTQGEKTQNSSSQLKFSAFFEKIVLSLKKCFIHLKRLFCPGLVSISITHVCILSQSR